MKLPFPEASAREAYGQTLVELGEERPDMVVVDADLSKSTLTRAFSQRFPNRFFDCGIAEQHMMSLAAGLAAGGKTVFASTFAIFATLRALDQIRMGIAQPRQNVKIVATHSGLSVGEDGFSHQAIEDLALMGALPGFTIVVPTDAPETIQVVRTAASAPGPFYIRLSRPKTPVIHDADYRFNLGHAETVQQGMDATIIACGIMVAKALEAALSLEARGIHCRVLNMATIKPLDGEAVLQAARETGALVIAEEHLEHGGLGSRVAAVVGQNYPVPLAMVAIRDSYGQSGKAEELLAKYGLTSGDIEKAVLSVLDRKKKHPK